MPGSAGASAFMDCCSPAPVNVNDTDPVVTGLKDSPSMVICAAKRLSSPTTSGLHSTNNSVLSVYSVYAKGAGPSSFDVSFLLLLQAVRPVRSKQAIKYCFMRCYLRVYACIPLYDSYA